jgi:ribonucleoside-diphosphate reductase alpha chain
MSFLKIGDRAAGASSRAAPRAAPPRWWWSTSITPTSRPFINWKVKEEQKVAALVTGSKIIAERLKAIMRACVNCDGAGRRLLRPYQNPALKREIKARQEALCRELHPRVIQFASRATPTRVPTYDTDWDSEAYLTVSGQNSNNSVRVTDDFLQAVERTATGS